MGTGSSWRTRAERGAAANTSARIATIADGRKSLVVGSPPVNVLQTTWQFSYSNGHLTGITNSINLPEAYTFNYSAGALVSPFDGSGYGTASLLTSVTTTGIGTAHTFGYNGSGEMTSLTTPLGGTLGWGYASNAYASRSYREVRTRTMSAGFGGMSNTWTITPDSGASLHG